MILVKEEKKEEKKQVSLKEFKIQLIIGGIAIIGLIGGLIFLKIIYYKNMYKLIKEGEISPLALIFPSTYMHRHRSARMF